MTAQHYKRVAVVILNYNGEQFLQKFLPDVITMSHKLAEIVVADNASTDGSLDYIEKLFPEVRLIKHSANYGFSEGYNKALALLNHEYFILLNSDIEVTPYWIEPLVDLMDRDELIAACQPKIRSFYQRTHFEYAGAGGGFIDRFGYPFCRGRLFQHLEPDEGQYNDITEVFWASGACMCVRASAFREAGGLDDSFFMHMEEIDFCWRLKNLGLKIMYQPQSVVFHVGGGTLPKVSARKTYYNFRNNLSMLFKNLPENQLLSVIVARLILDGVASLKFIANGGVGDFWAVARAHAHFYRKLPYLKKQRKKIRPKPVSLIFQRNIVFKYFLERKRTFNELHQDDFS